MTSGKWMPEIIFFPFLLVWVNDTFAYLSGSLLGKHKLFPRISPKKSWEGAIGGGLMTIIIGLCVSPYIEGYTIRDTAIISCIVVVFGIMEIYWNPCLNVVSNKGFRQYTTGTRGYFRQIRCNHIHNSAIFVYMEFMY